MMGLRDIGEALPPGFRFYPSDEELVCHYLYKKIANEDVLKGTLMEIDLHTCEPWQLPEMAKLNASEWYFFSFRDRKYATGYRTNRATTSGYWKATGKDRTVIDPTTREVVGMRKTLVFYKNRAPNGIKSGWIMHEFRLETPHMPPKEDWVLCRVFHKSKESENSSSSDLMNPYPNTFENTTTPCLSSAKQALSSHTFCQKPLSYGYPHQVPSSSPMNQTQSFTNMLNLSSVLNPSPFNFTPEEKNNTAAGSSITEINSIGGSGCDNDDYDFLWSMNMEEDSRFTTDSGQGVAPNLEEGIRFDVDRNSMLFF